MKTAIMTGLAAICLATAVGASTPATPGTLTIVGKQMGASIDGQFKKFTAQVQFDPANPAAGKATVEVDVASIDIGLEDFNQELRTRTWFDAKNHPKATFVSNAIKAGAAGHIEASGKLTIKGVTRAVTVPVAFKNEAGKRIFEGALPIRRRDFNIGDGEWKDTSIVADEVQIRFRIAVVSK